MGNGRLMSRALDLLLRMAPRDFRERFGQEIRQLLEVRSDHVARRLGAIGVWRFWSYNLLDITRTVIAERRAERWRRRYQKRKGNSVMATLLQDFDHALRSFGRNRGFASVAILTLALGIGANATVFSVVNAVLLKPLPYQNPGQLVTVWSEMPGYGFERFSGVTQSLYVHYRDNARTVHDLAAWGGDPVRLSGSEGSELIDAAVVSQNLFGTLGVGPARGRSFVDEEVQPGGPNVAILSYDLWQRRFGGDPDIIGSTLTFDDTPTEIVGVMPEGFRFLDPDMEVFRPLRIDREQLVSTSFYLSAVGRLAEGVDRVDAATEFQRLVPTLPETDPNGYFNEAAIGAAGLNSDIQFLVDDVVGDVRPALWILLGTVGLVMLIACANVANLFLVRAETRQKEVAVRVALGANRASVMRLFLTESVMLGTIAGIAGLGIAVVATRALVAFGPEQLPRLDGIEVNAPVILFTFGVSVLAGLLFGAFPAFRNSRPDLGTTLQQESRSGTTTRERQRVRGALVVVQVALALVLLIGSGLTVRSLVSLLRVDPGFSTEGVLTLRLSLPEAYDQRQPIVDFYRNLTEQLEGLPGVAAAGAGNRLPLNIGSGTSVRPEGFELGPDELPPVIFNDAVTPGYFESGGIPLIAGRTFETADQADIDQISSLIVSQGFVDQFWPGENAIGKRVRLGTPPTDPDEEDPWFTVVGVVGDVRGMGLNEDPVTHIYIPFAGGSRTNFVMVSATVDPATLGPAVRNLVWGIDSNVPITEMQTISKVLSDSRARSVFTVTLLGIAAIVALLLGTVGIYGVIAYVVSQRTREIGVRIALGANQGAVSRLVLRQGGVAVAIGVLAGLGGAMGLTRVMDSLLFDVSAYDPVTFGAAALVITAVALLASYVPARRAARVDPVEALRME